MAWRGCAALLVLAMAGGPALADDVVFFRTPSDNIHCGLIAGGGGLADCEIAEMSVRSPLPPRPADCDLDYGNRFQLEGAGPAIMGCYGDTVRTPDARVLAYGREIRVGQITCRSDSSGLTCRNGSGHGFFLSKGSQELF